MNKPPLSTEALTRLWVGCLVFSAAFAHFWAQQPFGVGWNRTASLPVGLYLTRQLPAAYEPKVGDLVCFSYNPPLWAHDRGYFPTGFRLCKPVAATEGASFRVGPTGLHVPPQPAAGKKDATFALPPEDSAGRPLPAWTPGEYRVPPGQVLALSPYHPRSLDSRFLGPLAKNSLTHRIWPVFTWSHPDSRL